MKEGPRIKSKTSLEKNGNTETEANELLRGSKIGVSTCVRVQNHVQNHVRKMFETILKTAFETMLKTMFEK